MKKQIKKFLTGVKVLAINCLQWGDTGKGKIVNLFSPWADIILRGVGADNAGHTAYYGSQEFIFHLLPSGIIYDAEGKINIIGRGTAVYPRALDQELVMLRSRNMTYNNLKISPLAKLILPTHIVLDRLREKLKSNGNGRIGTTGKGVGPVYTDQVNRSGLIVNDLLNPEIFIKKLVKHLADKRKILESYGPEVLEFISEIMQAEHLEQGIYYDPHLIFSQEVIFERYLEYGREFKSLIQDIDAYLQKQVGRKNILIEGAHGLLLSIDYGTYPFVTSSECSVHGSLRGTGLNSSDVDLSLGIMKGFYMTRVGCGPFPTELGGQLSDDWCNGGQANRQLEEQQFSNLLINSSGQNQEADFQQGIAIRLAGQEYGATTQRPRRTGWLDLPLLRYAWRCANLSRSRSGLIMTKLDVLNQLEFIPVCTHYIYRGPTYYWGNQTIKPGDEIREAIPLSEVLQHCQPVYQIFDGWQQELAGKNWHDLPKKLRKLIRFVESEGIPSFILSIGPRSEQTIFL